MVSFSVVTRSPRNWRKTNTVATIISSASTRPANLYGGVRDSFTGAVMRYTVRLKFGSVPYSANEANRTTITMAVSEVRIDRPTASPTPTGPPLA